MYSLRILQCTRVTVRLSVQTRNLSAQEVFGNVDLNKYANLPAAPLPPPPKLSLDEIVASGHSVLNELNLWAWWKPSSWFRWAFENIHMYAEIPWWATIIVATVALRLLLVKVSIMSQKAVAIQSKYKPELDNFRERINEAKAESNSQLIQQILLEQRDFLHSKNIRIGRQALIMLGNGAVFMTNFFALRGMANAKYPGFEREGTLWFPDLTAIDPNYILPLVSGLTMAAVVRLGVESGASSDQLSPLMRVGMQYALPIVVALSSSQFASALCVYWCTTNAISLTYSALFRLQPVRKFLNIPPLVKHPKTTPSLRSSWTQYKAKKAAPPRLESLRKKDAEEFKKAGRGKPVVF